VIALRFATDAIQPIGRFATPGRAKSVPVSIDNAGTIEAVHARLAPMIPVSASLRL
jgi:hypothetical protein